MSFMDDPLKEFCGPEILRESEMVGTCFRSSCLIQTSPCTDIVPECNALRSMAAVDPVQECDSIDILGMAPSLTG